MSRYASVTTEQCPNCGDPVHIRRLKPGERWGERECEACQRSTRATRKALRDPSGRGPAALSRRFNLGGGR